MVKDFIQRFSGGADGTNVTAASSGAGSSGTPFDQLIKNSGTDVTTAGDAFLQYSTAAALEGVMGAKMSSAGITGNTYARWSPPAGNGSRGIFRVPLNFPSAPGATHIIGRFSTPSTFFQYILQTNRTVQVINGSTQGGIVASNSSVLPPATPYWVECAATIGTTTSNGVLEYRVLTNSKADGTGTDTTVFSWSSGATLNTGTDTDFSNVRFHAPLATSGWTSLNTDLWRARFTNVTTDWLGPYVSTLPPSLVVSQPAPNIVDLRGSAVGDGSSLTFPTPTYISGPTVTVTSLAPGLWMFSQVNSGAPVYAVSASQGDGRSASSNVTIPAAVTATAPAVQLLTWTGTALV